MPQRISPSADRALPRRRSATVSARPRRDRHRGSAGPVPALGRRLHAGDLERRRDELHHLCHELLGAADHSLRTPLTSIVGYTEVLLDGDVGRLTPEQERMLQLIDTNCGRMLDLVHEMLGDVGNRLRT